jgi:hypothetical protein
MKMLFDLPWRKRQLLASLCSEAIIGLTNRTFPGLISQKTFGFIGFNLEAII